MSHVIHLSDAAYRALQALAAQQGESPDAVVERLIPAASHDDGPYYETKEWFRHLGVSEERIRRARELADRDDADAGTQRMARP